MKTSSYVNVRLLIIALFTWVTMSLTAQTTTVTGTVFDSANEPLIGASVVEKGKPGGVVTNLDGQFTINVTKPNATLVFTYVGMEMQEVALNGRKSIDVTMKDSSNSLEEVVVVGYGTMKKSDLAGASASVSEDAIKGSIITNLDQSLQGRVSGVTAISTSGAPGTSSSIRVRGQATINANAEPLYVIDGVIVQGGGNSGSDFGLGDALGNGKVSTVSPLSTINPQDIVSMEILKDASATAIYGAQGSNGVILITTKRGKAGQAKFTYEGMVAASRQNKRLDVMNLREYAEYYNDFVTNGYIRPSEYYKDPSLLGVGTNWQDAMFRTAWQTQHQISAQGGTDKVQYYVSGTYMDQEGTIIGSEFSRFAVRANMDAQMKSWLKLGMSTSYSQTDEDLKLADGEEGIIGYSLTTLPDIPIYDIDGNYATILREGYTSPNPIALAMMDEIKLARKKLSGNIFFDVTPLQNLTWHTEFDYDVSSSDANRYKPMVDLGGWVRSNNESHKQKNSNWYWALKNYISYNGNAFTHLNYSAMLGQECWESHWDYTGVDATGLPSDEVHNPSLGNPNSFAINTGWGSVSMASFFTRETLNWDDRYLLTYTFRYDGSSNFGPNNRWAPFNSVALAWRFSNEKFLQGLQPVLSNGKIRLGWGQTGNSNIGGYRWGAGISRMPSALGMGYRPANIPNPSIKWEKQEQWNVGLDLGMFNNRVNLTVDVYLKYSKDMLMAMQLPSYMGTSGNGSSALAAPWGNYGEIENKGLEIELRVIPVQTKDFDWESTFQISFNKNKLKSLTGTQNASLVGYGQWDDVVSVSEIGKPLYNFYGYVVEGIYQSYDDIINSPVSDHMPKDGDNIVTDPAAFNRTNTVWPGDIKFKDVNGDGKIDENDRTAIGSPLPDFTFGWSNTFRYKNLDLSVFINGSYGNDVLNYLAMNLTNMKSTWSNQLNTVMDHAVLVPIDPTKVYETGNWYEDVTNVIVSNTDTKTPRAGLNDPNDNDRLSTRYIEDGSYIRLKNISLGYTFPKSITKKLYLENLRIYANVQNLWTITKYKGYDPEIGASTQDAKGLVYGLDFGRYPSPTTYSFGLNISF